MRISQRKSEERRQRRERIVQAALRLFSDDGYAATSMDAIATQAGFSKRTVYGYFESKEDILAAVVLEALRIMNRMTEKNLETAGDGFSRAWACGRAFIDFQREHPRLYALLRDARTLFSPQSGGRGPSATIRAELLAENERNFGMLVGAIERGRSDGSMREDLDPRRSAMLVQCMGIGIVQVASEMVNQRSDVFPQGQDAFLDEALKFIGAALAPNGQRPCTGRGER
ncbi:MAG TPA: TetR/AcrR family transcriptional regulator [Spirochaetota bacterium]|nr:TetR/AcrR family transcriptional regulator [Spirochaetota bacterium]